MLDLFSVFYRSKGVEDLVTCFMTSIALEVMGNPLTRQIC